MVVAVEDVCEVVGVVAGGGAAVVVTGIPCGASSSQVLPGWRVIGAPLVLARGWVYR